MKNPSSYSRLSDLAVIGSTDTGHFYWIGHLPGGKNYFAGQTFNTPVNGFLKTIRIYPEMITGDTETVVSVYEFDPMRHEWKGKKAECRLMLNHSNAQSWVSFVMPDLQLDKNKQYAFRVSCNHHGMMAIAESGWKQTDSYREGEQWLASTDNPEGHFHKDFNLSFTAEIMTS